MKVVLGSMCRNSSGYLDRYFVQACSLRDRLISRGDDLSLVIAEGDSYDNTWDQLCERLPKFDVARPGFDGRVTSSYSVCLKRHHGSTHAWHSVDIPQRWKALAWVCNGILEKVQNLPDVDAFIFVESDLGWTAETMLTLLGHLDGGREAVAPMCFTAVNDFYDIWGHIKDGENFSPFPPYHRNLKSEGLTEIDSAGSCTAMLGEVVRSGVRYSSVDHCRGLGRDIRKNGYSLWVDPTVRVIHY